jgi:hypothetical protein
MSSIVHTIKLVASAKAAIDEIRKYQDQIVGTAQTVKRYEATLSGDKLLKDAHNWTAAVEKIGGATKLTRVEQERVNAVLQTAIEKYRALGQQAPTAMLSLEKATRQVDDRASGASTTLAKLATVISVAAIGAAVKGYVDYASAIQDGASKAGMAVEPFQRLSYAAKMNGLDMQAVAQGATVMARNLVGGKDSVASAVHTLGLNLGDLQRMDPADAFIAIGDAIAEVPNPMQQAALATAIFGKAGADYLPMFKGHLGELAAAADRMGIVLSKDAVDAADDFGDAMDSLKLVGMGLLSQVLTPLLPLIGQIAGALGSFAGEVLPKAISGVRYLIAGVAESMADLMANLGGLIADHPFLAKLLGLGTTEEAQVTNMIALGATSHELRQFAEQQKILAIVGNQSTESHKRQTAALRDLGEEAAKAGEKFRASVKAMPGVGTPLMMPSIGATESWEIPLLEQSALTAKTYRHTELPRGIWEAPSAAGQGNASSLTGPGLSLFSNFLGTSGILSQLAPTILQAATGGGSVTKAAGALLGGGLGSSLSSAIGTTLTKTLGGALNSILPGVGSLLGSGVGALVSKLFGPTKTQQAGRQADQQADTLRAQLEQQYGSLEAIRTLGAGAGEALYQAFGRRGVDGLKLVTGAFDKFKTNLNLQSEIDAAKAELASLQEQSVPTWASVSAIIEKYNGDLAVMGTRVNQLSTTAQATTMINEWQTLAAAGANMNGVTLMMADSMQAFIQTAMKAGVAIPENMRPILEYFLNAGMLIDANGEKLTDLGQLTWGAAVESDAEKTAKAMDALIAKIAELVDTLNGVPKAAAAIPGEIDVTVTRHWKEEGGYAGGSGTVEGAARGAYVTANGLRYLKTGGNVLRVAQWQARGTDNVPAMLSDGEFVWSAPAVRAVGASRLASAHRRAASGYASGGFVGQVPGEAGGPFVIHNHLYIDGREAAEALVPHLEGAARRAGRG